MKSQTVLIQKLVKDENFSFPNYQTDGSAGMDLSAFIKDGRPDAARSFLNAQSDRAQTVPISGLN